MSAVGLAVRRPVGIRGPFESAARAAGYLVLAVPLGILELLTLPTVVVTPTFARRLGALERRLANTVLRARVLPLPDERSYVRRVVAFFPLRFAAVAAAAAVAASLVALTCVFVLRAAEGLSGTSDRYIGPWALDPVIGAVLSILALAGAIVSVAVLDGFAGPLSDVSRRLLGTASPESGAVREALAESIGDKSLAIVYWLPDRESFVDEHGLPVELPEPDSRRTWTAVEHEGRRVAAIIHDADLDARPELVRAAAAASVLALDNERLKADLRARVEELRASRTRIVEASIEARRNLERDLHDGAQQLLVALSLDLQLLRARLTEPDTLPLVDGAIDKLVTALADLRELARGIHPAILTHRGLAAALVALIERTPIPVECESQLEERVSPAAEAAGYFVATEALTNVVKYAEATRAIVRVRREPDAITIEVEDDGVGGADPAKGSGLRGLADRVAALDGRLTVRSPAGEGTRVTAWIPARSTR